MIKSKLKLSLAASILVATYGYAGTVIAPNIAQIELSGDIELKAVQEKTDTETINKRTAEINLNLDAKSENGLEIYTSYKVFDGSQAATAGENIDDGFSVTHAYATLPIINGKGKVFAGLIPNFIYGTDAFDDGGEAWKVAVAAPVAKGVMVQVVSKVENEEEANKDKGDSGATAIRVDAKVNNFKVGAKYAQAYANKGDGSTPPAPADKEKKVKITTAYIMGEVGGVSLGAEYMSQKIDMVGVSSDPVTQKGYFLTASKDIVDGFNVGLSYLNLSKGMKGGDDFEPALIFEKDSIVSSGTKNTTAFIVPFFFSINENLTANAAYVNADIQGRDGKEVDLGITYAMDDNVELSAVYGKFDGDTGCEIDDQTKVEVAIAITF